MASRVRTRPQCSITPLTVPGYQVSEDLKTPDPSQPSPYSVLCLLFFNDESGFQEALKAKGEKVLGDIPNFSDKAPVLIGGKNIASSVSI